MVVVVKGKTPIGGASIDLRDLMLEKPSFIPMSICPAQQTCLCNENRCYSRYRLVYVSCDTLSNPFSYVPTLAAYHPLGRGKGQPLTVLTFNSKRAIRLTFKLIWGQLLAALIFDSKSASRLTFRLI